MDALIGASPSLTCRMSIVIRPNDKKNVDFHETIENAMSDEWAAKS